jgi:hypothetical protein
MDGNRFDSMAMMLANGTNRRKVLRGIAAGLAGAVGLRVLGAEAGQEKQAFCHATGNPASPWVVISIAKPAWKAHLAHGDHPYLDCCADDDCGAREHCTDGTCVEDTCTVNGAMECAETGFVTCDHGTWVYRDCAPGTVCRPSEGSIICDWPQ